MTEYLQYYQGGDGMKRFKKAMALALAASLACGIFAGCGSNKTEQPKTAAQEEKVLTVYTARSESLNNLVIPAFEKERVFCCALLP